MSNLISPRPSTNHRDPRAGLSEELRDIAWRIAQAAPELAPDLRARLRGLLAAR